MAVSVIAPDSFIVYSDEGTKAEYTGSGQVSGRIAILAGGISTRMKKSERPDTPVDPALIDQANSIAKAMIGIGGASRPFLITCC